MFNPLFFSIYPFGGFMKLQLFKRTGQKKSESNAIRRAGQIPAIIYVQGKPAETIAVSQSELTSTLRQVIPGRLSTTVITLVDEGGKQRRVLIKDIQYHVTTYEVTHLDFEELHDNVKVNLNVPIECVGVVDCVGVKLGGVIRQVIRHLRVRCLPRHIPSSFELDIRSLGPREAKRLLDLPMPEGVRPLTSNMNEVAVVIVKR